METKYFTTSTILLIIFATVFLSLCQCAPLKKKLLFEDQSQPNTVSRFRIDFSDDVKERNGRDYFDGYPESRSTYYNTGYGTPTLYRNGGLQPYDK